MKRNCSCGVDCAFVAIAAAIIAGIVAAIAGVTAIITFTTVFYIVAFGIGVAFLAILLLVAPSLRRVLPDCYCDTNITLLSVGVLGTIFLSVVLLATAISTTAALGAILLGLLTASFTLLVASTVCAVKCIVDNCNQI